jgi:hypothetical protein
MPDREKVIKGLKCCNYYGFHEDCPYDKKDPNDEQDTTCMMDLMRDALDLLNEYEQSEQSYIITLVELSNERDKLLKELGREDEHKYKDGSFMAGGNGIVKL